MHKVRLFEELIQMSIVVTSPFNRSASEQSPSIADPSFAQSARLSLVTDLDHLHAICMSRSLPKRRHALCGCIHACRTSTRSHLEAVSGVLSDAIVSSGESTDELHSAVNGI